MDKNTLEKLHQDVLHTQVRIKTDKAGGSGTIIYSQQGKKGFSTYALTCCHVIEDAIKVKTEYDPKIGKNKKKEYRQMVTVEFFDYENVPHGHRPISNSVDGDVLAYDKTHDMALIKLRTIKQAPRVAKLYLLDEVENIKIGDDCYAVGCALLHDPILTKGMITHMGDEIDYKDYWMSSAQIIFGNSGGAVFYPINDEFYFVGIPSRVDVIGWGSAVTHLGYFSPITRVYQFLKDENFNFIFDKNYTEEQCEKTREDIKAKAEKYFEEDKDDKDESEKSESPTPN